MRNLANPNAGAEDFARPRAHIFPLVAREGGVLMRSGHTEAAVDLCRLAGLPPVGVICELVNDDGTVTRGPEVRDFAQKHGLKQLSVADLIAYRQRQETLIERGDVIPVDTPHGPALVHTYALTWDPMQHIAVVFGDIRDGADIPVRLHPESVVEDVFGREPAIADHMRRIAERGRGVIVYLREGSVGVGSFGSGRSASAGDSANPTTRRGCARTSGWKSASARRS